MLSKPTLPITRHGESAATLRLPMQALLSGQRRAEFMATVQTIATGASVRMRDGTVFKGVRECPETDR